ncbi:hypothetical protein PHAVU_005G077701 [Phaseolus vulgaris]
MKNITPSQFLFLSLLLLCFTSLAFGQNTTHPEEVKALKDIGKTLGNKNWDTDIDPCSNQPPWSVTPEINNVSCNCSIPTDTFCHVVSIILKSQNLSGTLPSELVRLPYLQKIHLSRNYLNGTIPPQWGFMKLVNMSNTKRIRKHHHTEKFSPGVQSIIWRASSRAWKSPST